MGGHPFSEPLCGAVLIFFGTIRDGTPHVKGKGGVCLASDALLVIRNVAKPTDAKNNI